MTVSPDTKDQLNGLFQELMGSVAISLYPYQERVALALLSDDNVILRAPTGAGKTWAALLPFLYAHKTGQPFADRVLYALPLRALASQLYKETKEACSRVKWAVNRIDSSDMGGSAYNDRPVVTIQIGGQQEDPFFQGSLIFTTIDQLLSAYLFSPVSLPGRLANINAGALLGSLIVFDEFHLLEPERSMGTTIEMLDRIKGYCRFVLMTATLSDNAVNWLKNRFDAKIIDLDRSEMDVIEGRKFDPTRRTWECMSAPMTAADILADHQRCRRSLVLTNTVRRAQQIYEELVQVKAEAGGRSETRIGLLHSRYYAEDRSIKEKEVITRLGKSSQENPEDFILVSTQVVEAGMDFSVDVLHSDLAPVNSLIQRAGRCARYGGEGWVKIYPVEHPAPYQAKILKKTSTALQELSGKVLAAAEERAVVDEVHGEHERQALEEYTNLYLRREKINQAIDGTLPGAVAELIRDVNSVNILVTADPEETIRFDLPDRWPEMLSIPAGTLRGFLKRTRPEVDGEWVVSVPVSQDTDGEEDLGLRFRWQPQSPGEMVWSWLVVIHSDYASYSPELGLVLGTAGGERQVKYQSRSRQARYHYRCETYQEHVQQVFRQLERAEQQGICARRRLACGLNIPEKIVEKAVHLAALFHDVGKLSSEWQERIKRWQEFKTPSRVPDEPLAHSDFNPITDWERQRKFARRPAHAVEGAYAVHEYLYRAVFADYPDVAACVWTAIARHHTGHAVTLKDFSLIADADEVVDISLSVAGMPPAKGLLKDKPDNVLCGERGEFARGLLAATRQEDRNWLPLYWHIVRRLRLADQAGSAEGGKA
jgi:CRISPR-associated endonuclease/helicase Cas3